MLFLSEENVNAKEMMKLGYDDDMMDYLNCDEIIYKKFCIKCELVFFTKNKEKIVCDNCKKPSVIYGWIKKN